MNSQGHEMIKRMTSKVFFSLVLYFPESSVSTVAVCAGSGASVLDGVRADLYITGTSEIFTAYIQTSYFMCYHLFSAI